ncbi:hypothetical protein [Nocardia sp. IFM 10818]
MSDLDELETAIRRQAEQKIAVGRALAGSRDKLLSATEEYRKDYAAALKHFTEDELKAVGLLVDGVKPAPKTPPRRKAGGSKPSKTVAAPKDAPASAAPPAGNGADALTAPLEAKDSASA